MKYSIVVEVVNRATKNLKNIQKSLDGVNKRSSKVNKGFKNMKKMGGHLGVIVAIFKKIAAAIGAAAIAVVALTAKFALMAKETQRQATLAGTSATQLTAMGMAAKQLGVEQSQLADILKDVNDKVGDFLATGGGPMKDFFETIAPQVGVTADQFRNLSGKDALQLYVTSLERANLSQAEMTFFMEAMGNDATALVGLFGNSGKALDEYVAKMERMGLVLDVASQEKLVGFGKAFNEVKAVITRLGQALATGFAPILTALAERLTSLANPELFERFGRVAEKTARIIVLAFGVVADMLELQAANLQILTGTFKILAGAGSASMYIIEEAGVAVINTLITGFNKVKEIINDLTSLTRNAPAALKAMVPALSLFDNGNDLSMTDNISSSGGFSNGVAVMEQGAAELVDGANRIAAVYTGNGPGAQFSANIVAGAEAIKQEAEAAQIAADTMEVLGTTTDNTAAATNNLADSLNNSLAGAGATVPATIDAMKEKFDDLQSSLKGVGDTLTKDLATALRTGQGLWDAFGNFFGGLADMILQKIMEIVIVKPLMDSLFGSLGGMGGSGSGIFGKALGGLFGLEMFANGGNLAGGKYGIAGEAGPELIKGPATIHSNSDSLDMLRNGGGDSGAVYAPVFQTTVNPGDNTSPEEAKRFGEEFNRTIEAKVTETMAKMQNRQAAFRPGTAY